MVNLISLVVFALSLALGQVLFKKTAVVMAGRPFLDGFMAVLTEPLLYLALLLYGATTFLWIWILSRVPLTQAHPFVAGAMILVPILSVSLLGERVTFIFWIGIALVMIGILLTQFGIAGR
jgi:drug/metabolite transporter (DMT)-like permease